MARIRPLFNLEELIMKKLLTLLLSGVMVLILNGVVFGADPNYRVSTNNLNSLDHWSAYSWEINLVEGAGYDQTTETINKIELTFNDIYNYNNEANKLYISVLDSPETVDNTVRDWDNSWNLQHNTVDGYYDDENDVWTNYFLETKTSPFDSTVAVGKAKQLLSISDLDTIKNDITITFDTSSNPATNIDGVNDAGATSSISNNAAANLFTWAQDGIFELGFDPDCHFYASGVTLKIYTETLKHKTGGPVPEPDTLVLFGLGLLGVSALGRKRFGSMR